MRHPSVDVLTDYMARCHVAEFPVQQEQSKLVGQVESFVSSNLLDMLLPSEEKGKNCNIWV